MTALALQSFQLKNFKAIRDSGRIEFTTPLTVFIGNNGSGKSSLIEGLETYQTILEQDLDAAVNRWRGFEYIRNMAVPHLQQLRYGKRPHETNGVEFALRGRTPRTAFRATMTVNISPGGNDLFIQNETLTVAGRTVAERDAHGHVQSSLPNAELEGQALLDGRSIVRGVSEVADAIARWQFVTLNPFAMGSPRPQRRTGGSIHLANDGSNIAEYLLDIRRQDVSAFEGIVETLQYVLPYARDLQPNLTSELERTVYLQLTEGAYKVPGWLLSTGTLRIVALLALLRHPNPPPLIVIEEIENGLDPRTIHLIVEEIRAAVDAGASQIIATTHSPYFLDLLSLEDIVLVERTANGPVFARPADQQELSEWSRNFGPGQLYTMSRLSTQRST